MAQTVLTVEILKAALEGFDAQRKRIDAQIAEIKNALHDGRSSAVSSETAEPKRKVSAAARKRMAAAQRKRWAAIKKKSASQR
jgi:hypothetical protein